MNRSRSLILVLTIGASLVSASSAHAAVGDLDRSYGKKGQAVLKLGQPSAATAALAQEDGRVLVAGVIGKGAGEEFSDRIQTGFVARLTAGGKLDSSFGVKGVVRLGPAHGVRLSATPGGTVYAFCSTRYQGVDGIYALSRDGSAINSFGVNGRRSLREVIPGFNTNAIAAQGENLLVTGVSNAPDQLSGAGVLTRLTPSGSVDTGFGTSGTVQLGNAATNSESALVVLRDGSIVTDFRDSNKLSRDGVVDTSFRFGSTPGGYTGGLPVGQLKIAATPSGGFAVVSTYEGNTGYFSAHYAWRWDAAGAFVPGTQGSVMGGFPVVLANGSVVAIGLDRTRSAQYGTRSDFSILPADGGVPVNIRQAVGRRSVADAAAPLPERDFLMVGQTCGATCNAVATKVLTSESAPPKRSPGLKLPAPGVYGVGKPRVISGTARPAKGIKSVHVAVLRNPAGFGPQTSCEWLNRKKKGRRFTNRADFRTGLCGKPIFLRASGKKHWSLKLPKLLSKDYRDYEVYVRVNWRGGRYNALTRDPGTFSTFTVVGTNP